MRHVLPDRQSAPPRIRGQWRRWPAQSLLRGLAAPGCDPVLARGRLGSFSFGYPHVCHHGAPVKLYAQRAHRSLLGTASLSDSPQGDRQARKVTYQKCLRLWAKLTSRLGLLDDSLIVLFRVIIMAMPTSPILTTAEADMRTAITL